MLLAALATITTARLAPHESKPRPIMANIDSDGGDWLRWSDDALTSATGERDRATLRIINECSKPLHVQWVTADGKLKNRRASRRARGATPSSTTP